MVKNEHQRAFRVALHNLGCKVNGYETEAMSGMFFERGFQIVPFTEEADVYVINTCTVTNMADRKSRQMLHRARKKNPGALVVAVGCYVQADKEAVEQDPAIDLMVGNNQKGKIVTLVERMLAEREALPGLSSDEGVEEEPAVKSAVIDLNQPREYEELRLERTMEHTRAYIKVQDGCNQFCSYCLIPYVRGRVRSRLSESVCDEIKGLAAKGYQEVVLTGIHLSSYGRDFEPGTQTADLPGLIRRVAEIEGIRRIRLGSLEPRIITEEFASELSAVPKICPHFHLSLQSGCDATLKRMNRHYTAAEYAKKCGILRKYFANPALTTDVIAGFPGETEEEFAETLRFVEQIGFFETHIFKYSMRKGTAAADMPGQVGETIKTARSNRLLALNARQQKQYLSSWVGREVKVLFEDAVSDGVERYFTGYTPEYCRVYVKTDEDITNCIKNVHILEIFQDSALLGVVF